jgi:sorting nexin-8
MPLFGTSPPNGNGASSHAALFDDDDHANAAVAVSSSALFGDDTDMSGSSHWDVPPALVPPAPHHHHRRSRSRADVIRTLLAADDLPPAYHDAYAAALHDGPVDAPDGGGARAGPAAVAAMFAAARVPPDQQAHIMNVMAVDDADALALDRAEFAVLLALVGLAQEREPVSLDGVDERRQSECGGQ